MIIRHTFNNGNSFENRRNINKDNNNYLDEQKRGLRKSIDNLDERYKKGEIDITKFKKIAGNYATQHENLNQKINKNN